MPFFIPLGFLKISITATVYHRYVGAGFKPAPTKVLQIFLLQQFAFKGIDCIIQRNLDSKRIIYSDKGKPWVTRGRKVKGSLETQGSSLRDAGEKKDSLTAEDI